MKTIIKKVESIKKMDNDKVWKRKAGITMTCQLNPPILEIVDERHEITTRYIVVK